MNRNKLSKPVISEVAVYEGGELMPITVPDLLHNEVVIKQLVNNNNLNQIKLKESEDKIISLTSSLEYIKTTPFIAIMSACLNVLGTILVGIFSTQSKMSCVLIARLVVVISSLLPVLFPHAKSWYNKKSI